ncbi:MAG: sugar phosphate isomerase/epimerase [Candidatus Brockarchaeota archaeon]|nr:sugar phosphate isomerase/epimerase [Candidatus Brockarchaeota archaeon]
MFVGFLTSGQLGDLRRTLEWAEAKGFKSISIATDPGSSFFNVNEVVSNPRVVKDVLNSSMTIVSAIGFYGNPIDPVEEKRKTAREFFKQLIEAAYRIEVPVVTGWIGLHPGSMEENIREIGRTWPEIINLAEDRGIRIAIENCPGNIAYRPDIWRRIFEAIPSRNLGLEFDPSHLICQMIDAVRAADEFGDRIYHTHMKDAQILWEKVAENGIRSEGWCPHRLPGFGELDWADFITVLKKHKYDYALSIEHEDPFYEYKEGLLLAKKFLEQFIP